MLPSVLAGFLLLDVVAIASVRWCGVTLPLRPAEPTGLRHAEGETHIADVERDASRSELLG